MAIKSSFLKGLVSMALQPDSFINLLSSEVAYAVFTGVAIINGKEPKNLI
ncbi:MAG: hypothetical protein JJE44_12390 [Flavobacteriaceae bacterium]|nr:hypothetical protein [Flavobacteriaceae bacterium]